MVYLGGSSGKQRERESRKKETGKEKNTIVMNEFVTTMDKLNTKPPGTLSATMCRIMLRIVSLKEEEESSG